MLAPRTGWRVFKRLDPNGNPLVGTRRRARLLREAIGDVRIEDLPIRLAAAAMNLDIREARPVPTLPDGWIRVPTGHILLFALDPAPESLERGEQAARVALARPEQTMARPRWSRRLIPQAA